MAAQGGKIVRAGNDEYVVLWANANIVIRHIKGSSVYQKRIVMPEIMREIFDVCEHDANNIIFYGYVTEIDQCTVGFLLYNIPSKSWDGTTGFIFR